MSILVLNSGGDGDGDPDIEHPRSQRTVEGGMTLSSGSQLSRTAEGAIFVDNGDGDGDEDGSILILVLNERWREAILVLVLNERRR